MTNFHVIDVFPQATLKGNPVMVVLPSDQLPDREMQAFAAWNGMPETVYLFDRAVVQGDITYSVRIFSPRAELAFAGHPSLGAAHVAVTSEFGNRTALTLLDQGFAGLEGPILGLRQNSSSGTIELKVLQACSDSEYVFVKTPISAMVMKLSALEVQNVCAALGLKYINSSLVPSQAFCVRTGASWVVIRLSGASDMEKIIPNMALIESLSKELGVSGITAYAKLEKLGGGLDEASFEVRSFGPAIGVQEDAVCGGGNACVAALENHLLGEMASATLPTTYCTRQGRFVGRDGQVRLHGPVEDGRFWIGGKATTVMSGSVNL